MLVAINAAETVAEPEPALAPNPLELFMPGGPALDLPVTDADLDHALTLVLTHYGDQDARIRAAKKARAALAPAIDDAAAEAPYLVEANGVVQILGSSGYYTVTDAECYKRGVTVARKKGQGRTRVYCKGWIHTGGLCYHVVARELIRLAQLLRYGAESTTADDDQPQLAAAGAERAIVFVAVADLHAAIRDVQAHGDSPALTLDWTAATGQLRLWAGSASALVAGYGSGMAALNVDLAALLTLLQPALHVADEPECGLRFGTAPIVSLITSTQSVNVRGMDLT